MSRIVGEVMETLLLKKPTLEIKNGNSIFCPKDNATWILITGQPTGVSSLPPKTYFWNYDAATKNLSLYN